MMRRRLTFGSVFAVLLVGCGGGGASRTSTGGGGTTAMMGQAGATVSGAAGETPSGAGNDTGAAGAATPSGAAGTTGGAAGNDGAGGGVAGATGAAGTPGAGGTIGAAGTTGGAGTRGAAGTTGAAGSSDGRPSGPSAGCMAQVPDEPIGKAVQHNMMVTVDAAFAPQYVSRKYFTTMPTGYDGTKAYPVVFWGPGCGATGAEGSSFTTGHFLTDILYVQLISVTGCFEAGKEGAADSPDGPYFDQALAEVSARYCIDKGKVFAAGTSSGAWLSNYLACARGNVIRGTAADSGGLQHDHGTCTGGAAVMEMPGDSTVTLVNGVDIGSGQARDMFIKLNGCSMTPTTMTFGKPTNCQLYGGCASPVVWCDVGGAHQSGNQVIAESAWAFWNTLQ